MLKNLRKKIDKIDYKIAQLLSCRFKITKEVGLYKKKYQLKSCDKTREKEMTEQREKWAREFEINPKLIICLFKLIISEVKKEHKKL